MSEPSAIERLAQALRELAVLSSERAQAETHVEATLAAQRMKADRDAKTGRQRLGSQRDAAKNAIETQLASDTEAVELKSQQARVEADQALEEVRTREISKHAAADEKARRLAEDARWEASTIYEVAVGDAKKRFDAGQRSIAAARDRASHIQSDSIRLFRAYLLKVAVPEGQVVVPEGDEPVAAMERHVEEADTRLSKMERSFLVQLSRGWAIIPWLALAIIGPLVWAWMRDKGEVKFDSTLILLIAGGVAFVVGLWLLTRYLTSRRAGVWASRLADSRVTADHAENFVLNTRDTDFRQAELRKNQEILKTDETLLKRKIELQKRRDQELDRAEAEHGQKIASIYSNRESQIHSLEDQAEQKLAKSRLEHETLLAAFEEKHGRIARDLLEAQEQARAHMVSNWREAMDRLDDLTDETWRNCRQLFPDWTNADSASIAAWAPPESMPPFLRFGEMEIDRAKISEGTTDHPLMKDFGRQRFNLPALLEFPRQSSVLVKAQDEGRDQAAAFLQTLMFRLLTSVPPSKVRFTLVDPVGLGESFAAFMHLADYDEQLVTSRIWTEPHHIEQRLADLSEHMENVIQKYLRNEFNSIVEYNRQAGEIAEPLRYLVVANFPANFSEQTARRLASIAASGPRCGVFVLMTIDARQPLPSGISLADFEPYALNLSIKGGRASWRHPDFGTFPLTLDPLPNPDVVTKVLHHVGALAKEAKRVIVPFEIIAPKSRESWWTGDSRHGLDVPLGRTGANKLQHLRLGEGTSQHVLIAGKTGSGKSTLLHALITNAALRYSPDEVELYLIDFKKGVEFKVYASSHLPHARVVAIESEREFGLSVLQRLDEELRRRGDRFRELGVQDLAGARAASPTPLPRVLLIVDEFQEFFVEDDKVAQDASLYLDRLVRQGRAFGIHVNLGSQTLSGAYSLARSTLGQMAVRIALQCSETDAHLILSEDNTAARLLSRPGEAIYNDANGMIEGNNFFQIVWLGEEKKENYLKALTETAAARKWRRVHPQIVFEGNVAADLTRNHLIEKYIAMDDWPSQVRSSQGWLGDAVAIKDPTAAPFRPQAGANLLAVGQYDELALGILTASVIGLAVQHPPTDAGSPPRFLILDGTPVDSPQADWLKSLARYLPHKPRVGNWRDAAAQTTLLHEEMTKRLEQPDVEHSPLFLIIFGLQNFRDLRKQEDDFSFGRMDEEKQASPSKLFGELLRDGPGVGIHLLIWCDSLNNLYRSLERGALRDFDMRVLFQMSINDSSSLIDSAAANRLGPNRALYYSEDRPQPEKFRPYGLPERDWLERFSAKLHPRSAATATTDPIAPRPFLETESAAAL